jgi:peptidoglycan/LPS O-acetylase OafA/YrhL
MAASSSPGWRATEFLRDAGTSVLGNGWSSFALWDLAILAPLCMVMLAVTHPLAMNPGERAGRALQFLAGGTFSIYCFHAPLLLLLRSSGAYAGNSAAEALLAAMLVVAACLGLSMLTERRKAGWVWFWTKMIHRNSGVIRHA